MKKKMLALLLACSMMFGQNVYATELVNTESTDTTEAVSETEEMQEESETDEAQELQEAGETEASGTVDIYAKGFDGETQIMYVDNPFTLAKYGNFGNGKYSIASSDESICTATISYSWERGMDMDINPLSEGSAILYVKDADGNTKYEQKIEVRKDLPEDAAPIKDVELKKTILEIGNNSEDGYISMDELNSIESLTIHSEDCSGLEYAANLRTLNIFDDDVIDISSIEKLTQLTKLRIASANVTDISAVGKLSNLKWLDIGYTNVSDISPVANLTNLERFYADNTNVSDVSPLSNLKKLTYLGFNNCNKLSSVKPLYGLPELKAVFLSGTGIPDSEKLDIIKILTEKNEYTKGEKLDLDGCSKTMLSNVQVTGGNGVVDITEDTKTSDNLTAYSITMQKEGNVELTLTLNNDTIKVNIVINGIDSNQSIESDKNSDLIVEKNEVYKYDGSEYDYHLGEVNCYTQISSAILTNNGDLWQTYPKAKKVQSNVKKYVSKWVYWGNYDTDYKVCDFRLDNNNDLWSGSKKILTNVKDVDGRYALKNDNTLVDVYHENGDSISNVKNWKESSSYWDSTFYDQTLILKNDGSLWRKLMNSTDQSLVLVDNNVKELHEAGYLKTDGEYVSYRDERIIASDVSEVDDDNLCFYYSDGSCSLSLDSSYDYEHIALGGTKIKSRSGNWIILQNNQLYYKPFGNNTITKKADNIDSFVVDGVKTINGEFFSIVNNNLESTDKAIIQRSENRNYSIVVDTNAEFGMLQRNGVNILDNVKDVWNTSDEDYALRTDGTIWKVRGIPTMYMDLNASNIIPGDVDGDDKVTTKDLMIVLYGVSGRNELTDDQKTAADIDGDGKVTISDLTRILYYVSGRNITL